MTVDVRTLNEAVLAPAGMVTVGTVGVAALLVFVIVTTAPVRLRGLPRGTAGCKQNAKRTAPISREAALAR